MSIVEKKILLSVLPKSKTSPPQYKKYFSRCLLKILFSRFSVIFQVECEPRENTCGVGSDPQILVRTPRQNSRKSSEGNPAAIATNTEARSEGQACVSDRSQHKHGHF